MKICKVDGCNGKHHGEGYCGKHYMQFKRYGESLTPPYKQHKSCKVEGCYNKHKGLGYCSKHLYQYKKYGESLTPPLKQKNEIIKYEDYAEIVLLDKYENEKDRTIIDLKVIDKVAKYKWCVDNKGYVRNDEVGLLHRFIVDCPEDMVVDHINHNPLDNRKCNLRVCTQAQNSMNTSKTKKNGITSQYKGVGFHKKSGKWRSRICINGKQKCLGYYDNEYDASVAYDKSAILYHGIYCNLNHSIDNYIDYIKELGLEPDDFKL